MKNPTRKKRAKRTGRADRERQKAKGRLKPVSLHPLDFDDAMKGLVSARTDPLPRSRQKR